MERVELSRFCLRDRRSSQFELHRRESFLWSGREAAPLRTPRSPWAVNVLPGMSHAPIMQWSPVEDSNLRHSVCRTDVLAAELTGVPLCLKCWWSELESSQPLRVFGATLIRLSYPTTKVEER